MEFKHGKIPTENISTLTAYISDIELLNGGKHIAQVITNELVKALIYSKVADLQFIVNEHLTSPETRIFIKEEINKTIRKIIESQANEILNRGKNENTQDN